MGTLLQNRLGKSLHACRPKGHCGHQGIFLILRGGSRSDEGILILSILCMKESWAERLEEHWISTTVPTAVDSFLPLLLMKAASSGKIKFPPTLSWWYRLRPATSCVFQVAALRVGREQRQRVRVGHDKAPVPQGGYEREAAWKAIAMQCYLPNREN